MLALGVCALTAGCGKAADAPLPTVVDNPPITVPSVLGHVRSLPGGRYPGGPGHDAARAFLRERFQGWGYEVKEHVFEWDGLPGRELVNLEVRLPAAEETEHFVLVGAHWDAVPNSPGADDNGSGVAVILEVARRLAERSLPSEVRLVLFDAEEAGLAGSREYAQAMTESEREQCAGVIDLEMVGYTDRRPGSQAMPMGARLLHDTGTVGDFVLVLGNQASQPLAETVGLALGSGDLEVMRPEVFAALPGVGWLMPDSRRSDHASFWDVGIPAVMVTDTANFRNPNYHLPSDTAETLDGEFLAAVARGVERAVLLLADDDPD